MQKRKYSKNVIRGPLFLDRGDHYPGWSISAAHDDYKAGLCFTYQCIASTDYAHEEIHYHDYPELLCFFGGNADKMDDFGAEIHICLGEEMEEYVITSPTVVSLPPGLIHCPLTVKKCDKPIAFLMIANTKEYPGDVHIVEPHKTKEKAGESKAKAERRPTDGVNW